jgi:hypothetical protein
MYGDKVTIEYHDMNIPEVYEQHKALLKSVPEQYNYYPMVFVNGELKIAGSAEYYEVLYAVREAFEPVQN